MSPKRIGLTVTAIFVAAAGVVLGLYIALFLSSLPKTVAAKAPAPRQARLTLQTVAAMGHGPTPDWVSYFVKNAQGKWEHSTVWHLPAHSLVHVTVYQYDTATGLRNPLWGQPRGIVNGTMLINGKPAKMLDPDLASHTFAIPALGVSVPLKGIGDNAPHQCSNAPCTLQEAHNTIQFTFRTGAPGKYRWQCFVPCAAGFILGFGGPMQTIGYMDGYVVVS